MLINVCSQGVCGKLLWHWFEFTFLISSLCQLSHKLQIKSSWTFVRLAIFHCIVLQVGPIVLLNMSIASGFVFGNTNLFLAIPVIIIILLNILFLSNVIKMLRSKLTADASTQPLNARRNTSHRINSANMKQAKAALFLIPILGINYLLLPIRNCS